MLFGKTFPPTTGPRLFGSHYGVSEKNSMSPSNIERGHAQSAVGGLFNNIESFRKQHANAQNHGFMKCGIDFV